MTTEAPSEPSAVAEPPPPSTMEDEEAAEEAIAELRRIDDAEQFQPSPAAPPPISRYTAPMPPPQRAYMPPMYASPGGPGGPPAQRAAPPMPAVVPTQAAPHDPTWGAPQTAKDLKTLEDLYAAFPAIGDGQTCLRIERTQPKVHQNHSVAGWLGDLHEQIPMEEFAYRYGGQKYTVSVMVPVRGRVNPTGGEHMPMRRAAHVEVTIPGPPAMGTIPREEDAMAGRMPGLPGRSMQYYPGQDPTEVQLKRLDIEAQERERQSVEQRELRQQMGFAQRPPEAVFEAVREQAQHTVQMAEKNAQEKVAILQRQNDTLLASYSDKEKELSAARTQVLELQRQLGEAKYHTETEAVRSLKERHETELRKNNELHAQEMGRLTETHRGQIAEMSQRNNDDRQRLIEAETREKDRIRGDARDRESALHADVERRERLAKEMTDARVADIQRQLETQLTLLRDTTQRELQSAKDAHNREMNAVRTAEEMKTALSKETASIQVGSVQDRLQRAESDAARHRQEADELRSKVNKPFPEAMREAREVGMMIGLVEKGEGAAAGPEEELDWKKVAAGAVKDLIGQAGPTLKSVMEMRSANQQQQQVAQQQQAQQQAYAQQQMASQQSYGGYMQPGQPPQQQQPQQQVMAGRPAPRRRFAMAPPPAWAQAPGPPPPGSAPMAPPPSVVAPYGNPPTAAYIQAPPMSAVMMQPQSFGPADAPVGEDLRISHSPLDGPSPTADGAAAAAEAARMRGDGQRPPRPYEQDVPFPEPAAAQAPAQPAQGGYVSQFSGFQQPYAPPERVIVPPPSAQAGAVPELTSDQIASFITQLGQASASGIVPPAAFAKGFVEQAGAPVAADLLRRVQPEQLFEILSKTPGGDQTHIQTRDGQAYVRQVWAEARKMLGMG